MDHYRRALELNKVDGNTLNCNKEREDIEELKDDVHCKCCGKYKELNDGLCYDCDTELQDCRPSKK